MKTYNGQYMPYFLRLTGITHVRDDFREKEKEVIYKHEIDYLEEYHILREKIENEN